MPGSSHAETALAGRRDVLVLGDVWVVESSISCSTGEESWLGFNIDLVGYSRAEERSGGSKKEAPMRGGGMATLNEDDDVMPEMSAKRRGSSSLLRRASSFGSSTSRKEAKQDGGTSNRAGRSSRFSVFGRSKSPKR